MMSDLMVGPWVRRFLLEHLIKEKNLAQNTQRSYRDTFCLFLPFVAKKLRIPIDQLKVTDLSEHQVYLFLNHLEGSRQCGIATRNQRLAAIHAFARFVGERSPEHIAWCGAVRAVRFKRSPKPQVPYLEKAEMDALLNAPNCQTMQGLRDHVLLLFLYNSGARAHEAAQLTINDLDLSRSRQSMQASVRLVGKGNKVRQCPLWSKTSDELSHLTIHRDAHERVFLNRCGQPMTRFGIHAMVERYAQRVAANIPSLAKKRVSPHTIRHTTATHLLRAGVDINTIRAWLGHVSIETTNVYAEVDLEIKAKALAKCETTSTKKIKHWRDNPDVMTFLRKL
jgi:integrase/recombinase XerD